MLETGLSRGSRKAELFDNLFQSIDEEFGNSESVLPFHEWVERSSIILDGKPFTFERHEYLDDSLSGQSSRSVTEMKAAQMGLTSKAMLKVVYGARYGGYRGILYLFPSKSDVTDFSRAELIL